MSHKESERQSIPKSIRFEVFKRDKFTCQYCGRKAPDIILQIDHIIPVSKGGTNDLLNLIISCVDCNLGKSNRTLADTTIIDRKRSQMEELQDRREQIEMMMEWQRGLVALDQYLIEQLAEFWSELIESYSLTEYGKNSLKKLLRQYNPDDVMEAMRIAAKQYLQYKDDKPTEESVTQAWSKIGGICKLKKIEQNKPYMRHLFYIRGILRKRLHYVNEWLCIKLLEEAYQCGADIENMKNHACKVRNWTQWRQDIETFIQSTEEDNNNSDLFVQESPPPIEKYRETSADRETIIQVFEQCKNLELEMNFPAIAEVLNKFLGFINDKSLILYAEKHWFMVYENRKFTFNDSAYKARQEKHREVLEICLEAEQAGKFEVIADQLNNYLSYDPKSATWFIENFPGWCLTFDNGKFTIDEAAAAEIRHNIEVVNKVFEMCDFYAQQKDYSLVAEICNTYLDPEASNIEQMLNSVAHWFITVEYDQFIVDYDRLTELFNNRYNHWRIDYENKCIYTLDSTDEYSIGFETFQTDAQKQRWIQHLSQKSWSSPEMLAELTEIFECTFSVSR